MEHFVTSGAGNCAKCGKKITHLHHIDGKIYGGECARELLGKNVSAPGWLYELAETFVQIEIAEQKPSGEWYNNVGDLQVNFFTWCCQFEGTNLEYASGESKLWNGPVKIKGKSVKIDWQSEIAEYLAERYSHITNRSYDDNLGGYSGPREARNTC